jgi:hypothetical protein
MHALWRFPPPRRADEFVIPVVRARAIQSTRTVAGFAPPASYGVGGLQSSARALAAGGAYEYFSDRSICSGRGWTLAGKCTAGPTSLKSEAAGGR